MELIHTTMAVPNTPGNISVFNDCRNKLLTGKVFNIICLSRNEGNLATNEKQEIGCMAEKDIAQYVLKSNEVKNLKVLLNWRGYGEQCQKT